jgi:hypothetical protein
MALSRERAVNLSHRMIERLAGTAAVEIVREREVVRNAILQALLQWDRENERLRAEAARKIAARGRRAPEGSREWDLLMGEELEKAYAAVLSHGE